MFAAVSLSPYRLEVKLKFPKKILPVPLSFPAVKRTILNFSFVEFLTLTKISFRDQIHNTHIKQQFGKTKTFQMSFYIRNKMLLKVNIAAVVSHDEMEQGNQCNFCPGVRSKCKVNEKLMEGHTQSNGNPLSQCIILFKTNLIKIIIIRINLKISSSSVTFCVLSYI